jgi:chemotaxis response regulator CheB
MATVRAALLFEKDDFREPLRAALTAAGASACKEFKISQVSLEELRSCDATVLVVNLESILVGKPELLEALVNGIFPGSIVFNDAEATSQLGGADMARWARHLAAKIQGGTGLPPPPEHRPDRPVRKAQVTGDAGERDFELWVLGASIGGPEAVRGFLIELQENLPFAFILVQHIGQEFMDLMVGQLDQVSAYSVRCPRDGDLLQAGEILVVPADHELTVSQQHRIQLKAQDGNVAFSPCIDQVMIDAANRFGADSNAIVFSGMSNDGVAGARHILDRGGEVWVQDPDTCVVSSIVDGALKTGKVTNTGTPGQLAQWLNQRAADMAEASLSG